MSKINFCRYNGVSLLLLCASLLSACTVGTDFKQPDFAAVMQDEWSPPSETLQFRETGQPVDSWWQQFHDEQLNGLIDQLFTSSQALKQARERVVEVSARQGIISADKRLQLAAALGYTRAETGDEAVSLQGIPPGKKMDVFSAGVVAGWELDLWGRTARLLEAAQEDVRISYTDYHGMLVSLAAETTLAYVDARTIEGRIAMVESNIDLQKKSLELARTLFEAGNGTELAVVQAERLVVTSRARLPELKRLLVEAVNRIHVLLGQPPKSKILQPGSMPVVPSLIGLGLPVDLLTRRADIRRALAAYHGAVARTGAAEAEKYPTLSLSGNLTLSSDSVGGVFDTDSLIYSLGPGLKFPILTGDRIQSNIAVHQSRAEQAKLALEQRIVEALAEVENSAEGVVRSQQQTERLTQAEKLAAKSVHLADELYQAGLSDFFQVLDSQQQLISIQESLLLARQQALSQVVRLYRALGGGWEQAPAAIAGNEGKDEKQKSTL